MSDDDRDIDIESDVSNQQKFKIIIKLRHKFLPKWISMRTDSSVYTLPCSLDCHNVAYNLLCWPAESFLSEFTIQYQYIAYISHFSML